MKKKVQFNKKRLHIEPIRSNNGLFINYDTPEESLSFRITPLSGNCGVLLMYDFIMNHGLRQNMSKSTLIQIFYSIFQNNEFDAEFGHGSEDFHANFLLTDREDGEIIEFCKILWPKKKWTNSFIGINPNSGNKLYTRTFTTDMIEKLYKELQE